MSPITHDEGMIYSKAPLRPGETCPKCDRRVPIPREKAEPRKRGQFNISVPKDAENGKEILETLFAAMRDKLVASGAFNYDRDCPPYYVIVAVAHDWLTNG